MKKILLTAIAFGMATVCLQAKPKAESEKGSCLPGHLTPRVNTNNTPED